MANENMTSEIALSMANKAIADAKNPLTFQDEIRDQLNDLAEVVIQAVARIRMLEAAVNYNAAIVKAMECYSDLEDATKAFHDCVPKKEGK